MTAREENAAECMRIFEKVGITAAVIGKVDDTRKLDIHNGSARATVFDFLKDDITGIDT
jgi:selenophosphate synthetase-related protein